MSTNFELELNGTITLRTDNVFRNSETSSKEHTLAFDHVSLTFENIDAVAEAFITAINSLVTGITPDSVIDGNVPLGDVDAAFDAINKPGRPCVLCGKVHEKA
jgi:hypothetical protein